MSSEQPFDCWVINMDAQRWVHMQSELSRTGIVAERFDAVRGLDIPDRFQEAFFDGSNRRAPLSDGEIGCYSSHLVLLERIVARGRPGLVLEDDLRLDRDIAQLPVFLPLLPEGWGAVRMTGIAKSPRRSVAILSSDRVLCEYMRLPHATGAILWSPRGAAAFLRAHEHRTLPIDEDLRRSWEHDVDVYGIEPPLAVQNLFESSLTELGRDDRAARHRFRASGSRQGGVRKIGWMLRKFGAVWLTRALLARLMRRGNTLLD